MDDSPADGTRIRLGCGDAVESAEEKDHCGDRHDDRECSDERQETHPESSR